MEVIDPVYGKFNIEEPVLLELINSKPVQRLKGIAQYGTSKYILENRKVSRYDHSVGVMLLLRKLGASLEEQIAGLLHDVPHTAFSHVIDFVFDNLEQDFHEKFHHKIINNSEIPNILGKYGYDVERIIDEHNFLLLERSAPDLCADRLDYTLRDYLEIIGDQKRVRNYLNHLIVRNNEIIVDDQEVALQLAEDYLKVDRNMWSRPLEVAFFQIHADAIKIALNENIITEDDMFKDDDYVFDKLRNSDNKEILSKLEMLNPNLKIEDNPDDYDIYSATKFRHINPKFVTSETSLDSSCTSNEKLQRVTDVSPGFKKYLKEYEKLVKRGNYIKIISW